MDFILFYSKHSQNCFNLLQEVPLLNEKAICIDSEACRSMISNLPYKVKRVPTLFVVDGLNKILKVIEGYYDIKNWFILTTYSMSQVVAGEEEPLQEGTQAEVVEDDLMRLQQASPIWADWDPIRNLKVYSKDR